MNLKYQVGETVLFHGQSQPPLTGDERRKCIVLEAKYDREAGCKTYKLKDIETSEISSNNYEWLIDPIES